VFGVKLPSAHWHNVSSCLKLNATACVILLIQVLWTRVVTVLTYVMSLHVCTSYMFLLFVLFVSTVVVNGEYATIRYSIYVRSKADAMASLI